MTFETTTPDRTELPPVKHAPLLKVDDLCIKIASGAGDIWPLRGVSLSLKPGERLGVVGESGSGKSLTARAIMGLLPARAHIHSGSITLEDTNLVSLPDAAMARIRGRRVAMVYQNPLTSLNPIKRIGAQLTEALRLMPDVSRREALQRARELLTEVGIPRPAERLASYPHELSGGMRQRVMIAMALAEEPAVLIADEATTSLDVTTQARILDLLDSVVSRRSLAVILITHDLGVASRFCETINVMYAGRIVEKSPARRFFETPRHPYSQKLIAAICRLDADTATPLPVIRGEPAAAHGWLRGCAFAPRCPIASTDCETTDPPVVLSEDGSIECLHADIASTLVS